MKEKKNNVASNQLVIEMKKYCKLKKTKIINTVENLKSSKTHRYWSWPMGPKKKAAAPPPPPPENYLKAADKQIVVKENTMPKEMKEAAVLAVTEGLEKYDTEREVAGHVKQKFDAEYGPYWQCTVGRNFGSYVSYEDFYTYFYLGKVAVLLYKNGRDEWETRGCLIKELMAIWKSSGPYLFRIDYLK